MEDCEYMSACPIFMKFHTEGFKNIFIRSYCQGVKQEDCARKKLKKEGKEVNPALLPNGEYLGHLGGK